MAKSFVYRKKANHKRNERAKNEFAWRMHINHNKIGTLPINYEIRSKHFHRLQQCANF